MKKTNKNFGITPLVFAFAMIMTGPVAAENEWPTWEYKKPTANADFDAFTGSANNGDGFFDNTESGSGGMTNVFVNANPDFATARARLEMQTVQLSNELDGTIATQDVLGGVAEAEAAAGLLKVLARTKADGLNNTMVNAVSDHGPKLAISRSVLESDQTSSAFDLGVLQDGDATVEVAGEAEVLGRSTGKNTSSVDASASSHVSGEGEVSVERNRSKKH